MRVMKFGGTSLANPARLDAAAHIVRQHHRQSPVTVVVSAMAGITDALLAVAQSPEHDTLERIATRHREAYIAVDGAVPELFDQQWAALLRDLADLREPHSPADQARDVAAFSGWGERLMTPLFARFLVREGLTAEGFVDAPVLLESVTLPADAPLGSVLATRAWLVPRLALWLTRHVTPVLPGYLARDAFGRLTTLGRNGSDYSAALIAAALGADALYIYSDVAGVYSADPHIDPTAVLYPSLTYAQATDLAARGAKVLHPRTIGPLVRSHIPLWLRSTLEPDRPGTVIGVPSESLPAPHPLPLAEPLP